MLIYKSTAKLLFFRKLYGMTTRNVLKNIFNLILFN